MLFRSALSLALLLVGSGTAVAKDARGTVNVYTVNFLPSGSFQKNSLIGQFTFIYDDTPLMFDGSNNYVRQSVRDLSGYLLSGDGRLYNDDMGGVVTTIFGYGSTAGEGPYAISGVIGGNQNGIETITGGTHDFSVTFEILPPPGPRYSPNSYFTGNSSAPVISEFTSSAISPVPEPMTWLTMLSGFGFLAWALRLRRDRLAGYMPTTAS